MCIPLTPVLYFLTTVIIEVYSQCFIESVSLRDIGKSTSRAEISSSSSLYFKAVKGAHIGSALICESRLGYILCKFFPQSCILPCINITMYLNRQVIFLCKIVNDFLSKTAQLIIVAQFLECFIVL